MKALAFYSLEAKKGGDHDPGGDGSKGSAFQPEQLPFRDRLLCHTGYRSTLLFPGYELLCHDDCLKQNSGKWSIKKKREDVLLLAKRCLSFLNP